ncbi:MAG: hypothetical protein KBC81_01805 [Candidatus Pacebacteria bacterium]|nr:hypothetical protein [Candidatus Paceibacterota bacterium]
MVVRDEDRVPIPAESRLVQRPDHPGQLFMMIPGRFVEGMEMPFVVPEPTSEKIEVPLMVEERPRPLKALLSGLLSFGRRRAG